MTFSNCDNFPYYNQLKYEQEVGTFNFELEQIIYFN